MAVTVRGLQACCGRATPEATAPCCAGAGSRASAQPCRCARPTGAPLACGACQAQRVTASQPLACRRPCALWVDAAELVLRCADAGRAAVPGRHQHVRQPGTLPGHQPPGGPGRQPAGPRPRRLAGGCAGATPWPGAGCTVTSMPGVCMPGSCLRAEAGQGWAWARLQAACQLPAEHRRPSCCRQLRRARATSPDPWTLLQTALACARPSPSQARPRCWRPCTAWLACRRPPPGLPRTPRVRPAAELVRAADLQLVAC